MTSTKQGSHYKDPVTLTPVPSIETTPTKFAMVEETHLNLIFWPYHTVCSPVYC